MSSPVDITTITGQETEDDFSFRLEEWLQYQTTDEEEARQTALLLHTLAEAESTNLIEIFLRVMAGQGGQHPYTSKLMLFRLSRSALAALTQVTDLDFYSLMYSLVEIRDETLMTHVVTNVNILFPDPEEIDLNAISGLLSRAIESNNYIMTGYLDDMIAKLEKGVAEVPGWIITGWRSSEDLERSVLPPEMLADWKGTLEEDVEYILSIAAREGLGVDLDDLRAQMLHNMQDDAERAIVMISLKNNQKLIDLRWDQETFRVFGACLQVPNGVTLAPVSRDPCQTRGGCRVMTCYQHENWDPITESVIFEDPTEEKGALVSLEWFQGDCQNCHRIIRKKCYAVRLPIESGGWRGCYCSFRCMREQTESARDVRHRMIDWFEDMYNRFGVYDRD